MIYYLSRNPEMDRYRKSLKDLARRILDDSGRSDAELSILVTDDREIGTLNLTYRDQDGPTDVLSFSQVEGEGLTGTHPLLGDVVISWQTAQRQASELGHSIQAELRRLLVHGTLHLLGYHHEGDEDEAKEMRGMEEKYLRSGN